MATDPICGMSVEPGSAAGKQEHNGQTYYFCSQHCLAKFKENPEKWLSAQQGGHVVHMQAAPQTPTTGKPDDAVYVCPMHPEVPRGRVRRLPEVRHGAGAPAPSLHL